MIQSQSGQNISIGDLTKIQVQSLMIDLVIVKHVLRNFLQKEKDQMMEVLFQISKGDFCKIQQSEFENSFILKKVQKFVKVWIDQNIIEVKGNTIQLIELMEMFLNKLFKNKQLQNKLKICSSLISQSQSDIEEVIVIIKEIQQNVSDFLSQIIKSNVLSQVKQFDWDENKNILEKRSVIFILFQFLSTCIDEFRNFVQIQKIENDHQNNVKQFPKSPAKTHQLVIIGDSQLADLIKEIDKKDGIFQEMEKIETLTALLWMHDINKDYECLQKLWLEILNDASIEVDQRNLSPIFDKEFILNLFDQLIAVRLKIKKFNLSLADTIRKIETAIKEKGLNSQFDNYENLIWLLEEIFYDYEKAQIDKLVDLKTYKEKIKPFNIILDELNQFLKKISIFNGITYTKFQIKNIVKQVNEILIEINIMNQLIMNMKELIIDEKGNKLLDCNHKEIKSLGTFELFLIQNNYSEKSVIVTLFCYLYDLNQKIKYEFCEKEFTFSSIQSLTFQNFGAILFPKKMVKALEIFCLQGQKDYYDIQEILDEQIKKKIDDFKIGIPKGDKDQNLEKQED